MLATSQAWADQAQHHQGEAEDAWTCIFLQPRGPGVSSRRTLVNGLSVRSRASGAAWPSGGRGSSSGHAQALSGTSLTRALSSLPTSLPSSLSGAEVGTQGLMSARQELCHRAMPGPRDVGLTMVAALRFSLVHHCSTPNSVFLSLSLILSPSPPCLSVSVPDTVSVPYREGNTSWARSPSPRSSLHLQCTKSTGSLGLNSDSPLRKNRV